MRCIPVLVFAVSGAGLLGLLGISGFPGLVVVLPVMVVVLIGMEFVFFSAKAINTHVHTSVVTSRKE